MTGQFEFGYLGCFAADLDAIRGGDPDKGPAFLPGHIYVSRAVTEHLAPSDVMSAITTHIFLDDACPGVEDARAALALAREGGEVGEGARVITHHRPDHQSLLESCTNAVMNLLADGIDLATPEGRDALTRRVGAFTSTEVDEDPEHGEGEGEEDREAVSKAREESAEWGVRVARWTSASAAGGIKVITLPNAGEGAGRTLVCMASEAPRVGLDGVTPDADAEAAGAEVAREAAERVRRILGL